MSHILATTQGHILTLRLNRPEKKNALTREMYRDLADALNEASVNNEIKVVRLTAEGPCFTAGNDIADFAVKDEGNHISEVVAFMQALATFPNPVVADVRGVAVGIGTTLLLHCDLVYCSPETQFCLPFINLGLVPEYASSYLLPRLAGRRKASEWLMLGEPFDAQEAKNYGLITTIFPAESLEQNVSRVCNTLAAKPAFSLTQTKALMRNEDDEIQQQMSAEFDVFLKALSSEAAQEAFDAFIKKRPVDPDKFK